jgi:hypothetical protein
VVTVRVVVQIMGGGSGCGASCGGEGGEARQVLGGGWRGHRQEGDRGSDGGECEERLLLLVLWICRW